MELAISIPVEKVLNEKASGHTARGTVPRITPIQITMLGMFAQRDQRLEELPAHAGFAFPG